MPAHVEVPRPRRLGTRRVVVIVLVSGVSIHRLEDAMDRILLGQGVGGHDVRYRIVLEEEHVPPPVRQPRPARQSEEDHREVRRMVRRGRCRGRKGTAARRSRPRRRRRRRRRRYRRDFGAGTPPPSRMRVCGTPSAIRRRHPVPRTRSPAAAYTHRGRYRELTLSIVNRERLVIRIHTPGLERSVGPPSRAARRVQGIERRQGRRPARRSSARTSSCSSERVELARLLVTVLPLFPPPPVYDGGRPSFQSWWELMMSQ